MVWRDTAIHGNPVFELLKHMLWVFFLSGININLGNIYLRRSSTRGILLRSGGGFARAFIPDRACIRFSPTSGTTSTTVLTSTTSTIQSQSLTSQLSINPNPAVQGQNVQITATWSGGTPPYTTTLYSSYADTCSGSSSSISGFTANTETYIANAVAPGEYYCEVVTDSLGHSSQAGPVFDWVPQSSIPTTTAPPVLLHNHNNTVAITYIPTINKPQSCSIRAKGGDKCNLVWRDTAIHGNPVFELREHMFGLVFLKVWIHRKFHNLYRNCRRAWRILLRSGNKSARAFLPDWANIRFGSAICVTSTTIPTSVLTTSTTIPTSTTTTIKQTLVSIPGTIANDINDIINHLFGITSKAPTLTISNPNVTASIQQETITATAINSSDQLYLTVFPSSQVGYEGGSDQVYLTGTGTITYSVPTNVWESGTYTVLAGDTTVQPNTETSGKFTINPARLPKRTARAFRDLNPLHMIGIVGGKVPDIIQMFQAKRLL